QRPPKHGRAQADTPRREGRDVRASVDADDRSLPRPPQTPGGQRSGTNSEVDDSSRLRHDARGGRVEYLLVPGDEGTDAAVVLGQPDAEMRGDAHRLHGTMPAGAWRCPRLPSGANTGCRTRRNDTCGAPLREFFYRRRIAEMHAAAVRAAPSPKQPLAAGQEWISVGLNSDFVWRVPFNAPAWAGHHYVLELTREPITRAVRKTVAERI